MNSMTNIIAMLHPCITGVQLPPTEEIAVSYTHLDVYKRQEYDYPYISQMAEEAGLYCLCLEIDQSTQDNGQSKTKIQSYAEI